MGGMFKFVIFLVACVSLLFIFGEDVLKSDYVQKKFYPNDYWPPKIQGLKDQETNLRDLIYQTELDIEETKLLGKYAAIEAANKAKAEGINEKEAVTTAEAEQKQKIDMLLSQLNTYRSKLTETTELIKFASQYKKKKMEY